MTEFAFSNKRKLWYIISAVILLVSIGSLLVQGLNYGIDFTGGNIFELHFESSVSVDELRSFMEDKGWGYSIQEAGDSYIIRTEELSENESGKLLEDLESTFGPSEMLRNEKVSATVGEELTRKALTALAIASVLIIAYISFRFEFYFGIAAILALVHDVLITVGIFSLFQIGINSAFVAALLTIVGYSINDSIVIFDRIRENLNSRKKMAKEQVVDLSINQSLMRSLSTSFVLLLVLFSLYFLGGTTIRDFVLAMLIGTIFGTYSSIFVASPLWIDLHQWAKKRR